MTSAQPDRCPEETRQKTNDGTALSSPLAPGRQERELTDCRLMERAIALAREAAALGEVPVGAVVSLDGEIVGEGYNRRETDRSALRHAELIAIEDACSRLGGWRLHRCQLHVTLEPCPMCAGAIINARLLRVVYGARDPKAGSCESVVRLFELPYNHRPQVTAGVLEPDCSRLLTEFFARMRASRPRRRKFVPREAAEDCHPCHEPQR